MERIRDEYSRFEKPAYRKFHEAEKNGDRRRDDGHPLSLLEFFPIAHLSSVSMVSLFSPQELTGHQGAALRASSLETGYTWLTGGYKSAPGTDAVSGWPAGPEPSLASSFPPSASLIESRKTSFPSKAKWHRHLHYRCFYPIP